MKRIHVAALALALALCLFASLLPAPSAATVPGPGYCESLGPVTASGFGDCANYCRIQGCFIDYYELDTRCCFCETAY